MTKTATTVPTMMVLDQHRVAVSPGTYFLGDPCYAVPDKGESLYWMAVLESCGYFNCRSSTPLPGEPSPVGNAGGYPVVAFSTAYGDGRYLDQHGHEYPVDAGLIGLTPMALVHEANAKAVAAGAAPVVDVEWLAKGGQIVTFESGVIAETDGEGRMTFGPYEINTTDDTDDGCEFCGEPSCVWNECQDEDDEDDDA